MTTTYLQAVNSVLLGSNEVELTPSNFASAVGLQSYTKDVVNRSYLEICAREEEWPWLASAASNTFDPYGGNTTVETTSGTRWYLLKTAATDVRGDFSKVDWESFFMTNDGGTGEVSPFDYRNLTYITEQHWRDRFKIPEDLDAGTDGEQNFGIPSRVMESIDGRFFGLSPIPNGAYKVFFSGWIQPTSLSASTDEILIPDMYIPVLLHRARWYLLNFKKDINEADRAQTQYDRGLKMMRRNLIGNSDEYMRDDWFPRNGSISQ